MIDIINLFEGWDIFCIGRNSDNGYWLEARHIESGKLVRDLGLHIIHAPTLKEAVDKTNTMLINFEADVIGE